MLEARIEELTAAVVALTFAIQHSAQHPPHSHEDQKPQAQWTAEECAATTARQAAQVPNEKPQDSQKSKPTIDTSKPSSPESVAVTYDDVKKATNAVSAKLGREKAISGLARFGVQSATKLSEEQWPEYVAYMTRVAAGELDPEAGE